MRCALGYIAWAAATAYQLSTGHVQVSGHVSELLNFTNAVTMLINSS